MQSDVAYFGQKDFQQYGAIRQMMQDLQSPIESVTVPTIREADGFAMSSRNSYRSLSDRKRTRWISQDLFAAEAAFQKSERGSQTLVEVARARIPVVNQLQYLELREGRTLERMGGSGEQPAVLCAAASIGTTRLTDNLTPERRSSRASKRQPRRSDISVDGVSDPSN